MRKYRTFRGRSIRSLGFTLLELLAVIATIGALTAMLLPVLAKAKGKAQQANCISNLKNLGYAWYMYYGDNGGRLAESYPLNPDVWVKGDMRNPTEAVDNKLLENGKLYTYHRNTAIYHCPADQGVEINGKKVASVRSYSMNGFMGARDPTIGPLPHSAAGFVPFFVKDSDLARPSELWVLIDEDERSISDAFFMTDPTARVWWDLPSLAPHRHYYRYSLSYADGHAESWRLLDPKSRKVFKNETEQAGNRDLERLARASTVPK